MLKDITIGQYYKEDSLIHRLDPRVKLFAVLIYVITLFMHKAPATYVMSLLFLIITIKISKVPVKYILRGLKEGSSDLYVIHEDQYQIIPISILKLGALSTSFTFDWGRLSNKFLQKGSGQLFIWEAV